jgi:hypothetical protein
MVTIELEPEYLRFVQEALALARRARLDTASRGADGRLASRFQGSSLPFERELAAQASGLMSRVRLHVTGRVLPRRQGLTLIDDRPLRIPLREFRLLVRLVVGAVESDDGFVDKGHVHLGGGLVDEGYLRGATIDKVPTELRKCLAGALDVPGTDYIETASCRLRISAPRELLSWDDLSNYPDEKVRECATRLAARRPR